MRLAVTADDYGLTAGISRGILEAHGAGLVTGTSVLANGSGRLESLPWLLEWPDLAVGAHLAFVGEDPPVSAPASVPTLVGRDGRLAPTWRHLLARLIAGRIDPADLQREATAQMEVLARAGLTIRHLNTHQHVHLWPPVAAVLVEVAADWEIGVIRVPDSRRISVRAPALRRLAQSLRRRLAAAGLEAPEWFAGIEGAGHLHGPALDDVLAAAVESGARTAEIVVHPGRPGPADGDRYRWGYHWAEETDALCDPVRRSWLATAGVALVGQGGLHL